MATGLARHQVKFTGSTRMAWGGISAHPAQTTRNVLRRHAVAQRLEESELNCSNRAWASHTAGQDSRSTSDGGRPTMTAAAKKVFSFVGNV